MKNHFLSLGKFAHNIVQFVTPASLLLAGLLTTQISAKPIPENLGSGLRTLVEQQTSPKTGNPSQPSLINYDRLKITDAENRVLVDITLKGNVAFDVMQRRITALGGNKITATDARYRAGVIEGFVPISQVVSIAKMPGVSAVHLVLKPVTNIGKATTKGIVQHRIDKLPPSINGAGITVGVLSDSYNTSPFTNITASDDVASGDLPGANNPFGNTHRVAVLQDSFGADEGRAMLQIVHDIAPKAKLGFATAFTGQVEFGDNIRSLAGLPSGSKSRPGFKADVIIDDVIYLNEPMFQDGIVAQAVDDVAAAGVSYFSSAGNEPPSQGYASEFRFVPNSAAATAGTNLNFIGVDPALYKGGFHDFAPSGRQDIAQDVHIGGDGIISFQWNEPFDPMPLTLGAVLQSGSGTLTDAMPTKTFNFAGTAGQKIAIIADADPGSSNPLPDVTITLIDPQGNEIAFEDQTTNPETLISILPVTGTYKIRIGGFQGATGDFVYEVREATTSDLVESDFNLLFFNKNGHFLGAVAENNRATNRPIELAILFGPLDVQMVIARANKPLPGVRAADHLRYVWFDEGFPMEYISYAAPSTYGHSCAAGANGVAAYAFYPPFVPERFTSQGPVTVYFDRNNKRLPQPERRLRPNMAAMDGANTTFFVVDVNQDPDDLPNFFGTSASAPHAGAIAALMLHAAGGPHSLLPNEVRQAMQASAFLHDLDPSHAEAVANAGPHLVFLSAKGDGSEETSSIDPNFFKVSYFGGNSLISLTLDMTNADPTQRPTRGLVFDTRVDEGFPFTLGHSVGVPASAISAHFSVPAPPPGVAGQFQLLTVSIEQGEMANGDLIHFGVDRDEADSFGPNGSTTRGNTADLLGSGVLIPQGTIVPGGATFSATLGNGQVLKGTFMNTIDHGYSRLDGFGFVNAEKAVNAVQKP